jgi:hypothetical protein
MTARNRGDLTRKADQILRRAKSYRLTSDRLDEGYGEMIHPRRRNTGLKPLPPTPPGDKAELRALSESATQSGVAIKKCPFNKLRRPRRKTRRRAVA